MPRRGTTVGASKAFGRTDEEVGLAGACAGATTGPRAVGIQQHLSPDPTTLRRPEPEEWTGRRVEGTAGTGSMATARWATGSGPWLSSEIGKEGTHGYVAFVVQAASCGTAQNAVTVVAADGPTDQDRAPHVLFGSTGWYLREDTHTKGCLFHLLDLMQVNLHALPYRPLLLESFDFFPIINIVRAHHKILYT